jgi:hypothetical protein
MSISKTKPRRIGRSRYPSISRFIIGNVIYVVGMELWVRHDINNFKLKSKYNAESCIVTCSSWCSS